VLLNLLVVLRLNLILNGVHILLIIIIPEVILLFRVLRTLDLLIECLWKKRLSIRCCVSKIKLAVLLGKVVLWCGLYRTKLVHLYK
jgi:hypothetical protein